ncbi:MAG: ABC transporter permease [Acidimicrobiia bacterium]
MRLRRILSIIPIVLVVSFLVFLLQEFLPGDPAATLAGEGATPERIEQVRDDLGLDDSVVQRYTAWLGDAVRGDLGTSLFTRRPVTQELGARYSVTFSLVIGALLVSIVVSVPAGMLAAVYRGRWPDRLTTVLATLGVAVPHFIIGLFMLVIFGLTLRWLPTGGYVPWAVNPGDWFRHLVIPVLSLSGIMIAQMTRQIRSSMVEVLDQDYVRTARAKGLSAGAIATKHVFRMAAGPTLAIMSVQVARLLGGVVVIETVFALPGLGRFTAESIMLRDLPVIAGIVPFAVLLTVLADVLADVAQTALNPRLRERLP